MKGHTHLETSAPTSLVYLSPSTGSPNLDLYKRRISATVKEKDFQVQAVPFTSVNEKDFCHLPKTGPSR